MYTRSMQEAASGAALPGDESPIPMLHADFTRFTSKSVHISANLPAGSKDDPGVLDPLMLACQTCAFVSMRHPFRADSGGTLQLYFCRGIVALRNRAGKVFNHEGCGVVTSTSHTVAGRVPIPDRFSQQNF